MNADFENGFRAELNKVAFAEGFLDELGMEKDALLGMLAAGAAAIGLMGAGATAVGASGFGKPPGMPKRRWFSASRDVPKIFGRLGRAGAAAAFPGTTAAIEAGSMAMGGGLKGSSFAAAPAQRFQYRPPKISGMTQQGAF